MKKGKTIIGAMAFVLAIGGAFAFKARTTGPGNLYYFVEGLCQISPCATYRETDDPCDWVWTLYNDNLCTDPFVGQAWFTENGK